MIFLSYDWTTKKRTELTETDNCQNLIERFNIYAGMRKKWLPPSYGKKVYTDLSEEEKEVVNSFQGEEAYNEVMNNADYFLAPVTKSNVLMIEG